MIWIKITDFPGGFDLRVKPVYLIIAVLMLFFVFSYFNSFEKVENNLRDSILQSRGKVDTDIVIVGIDDYSLQELGRWPWPRTVMAEMIEVLSEGRPAVIGIDVTFTDRTTPEEDNALVEAVKKAGNVVIGVKGTFGRERGAELKAIGLDESFEELAGVSVSGHINNMIDSDNIARTNLYSFKYQDREIISFDWKVYEKYLESTGKKAVGAKPVLDDINRWHIPFTGRPFDYEHHSFVTVLRGEIPAEYFENKIVLIGPYTEGMLDSFLTPLDHQQQMHGVEIRANSIQAIMQGNFKRESPALLNLLVLLLVGAASYLAFRKLSPAKSAAGTAAFIAAYVIFSRFIYGKGLIMRIFYPIALVAVSYLIMLAYRYIEEYLERKRITGVFGRYVAPQVVDEILKNGEEGLKLGGTRREITALFVDIRGFTPMSEKCQPEEVVEILNDYLNLTASSIFKYGGTLDKFIGDATMAIFNAPLDLEDHAFKAVQTAWAMKEGSEVLRKGLEERFGRSVQFGVGVNTGYAVVGNIGAKFRMDYTAIGDTVNTAARLESNAKPGQILLSGSTYELVKDRVKVTPLGGLKVKGKEQEVPVYQLDGLL